MRDLSMEERLKRVVAGDSAMLAVLAKAVNNKYGAEGLRVLREAFEREFVPIQLQAAKQIGARTGNGDATDWVKIESYVSGIGGTELEVVESSPTRAVIRAKSCPRAAQVKKIFPDFCRLVFVGLDRAMALAINPKMEVHARKSLPSGDDCCELYCELRE